MPAIQIRFLLWERKQQMFWLTVIASWDHFWRERGKRRNPSRWRWGDKKKEWRRRRCIPCWRRRRMAGLPHSVCHSQEHGQAIVRIHATYTFPYGMCTCVNLTRRSKSQVIKFCFKDELKTKIGDVLDNLRIFTKSHYFFLIYYSEDT